MAKQLNKIALKTKSKLSLKSFFSNLCSSKVNNSTILNETCKPSPRIKTAPGECELTVRDDSPSNINDNDTQFDIDNLPMLLTTPEMRKQRSKLSSTFIDVTKVLDHGNDDFHNQSIDYSQIAHLNTQYRDSMLIECDFLHESQTMLNYMVVEQTEDNVFINHIYESPQAFSNRPSSFNDSLSEEFSQMFADSYGFQSNEFQTANSNLFQTINDQEIFI